MSSYTRIATLKTPGAFRVHAASLGLPLECEDRIETAPGSPLAAPLNADGFKVGNRFVIHPMEGWDGEPDGRPSELTRRRWRNFGLSGAKWIWGGEAMAVVHDGRANPNQVRIDSSTRDSLAGMLDELLEAHRAAAGSTSDLLVGFQLTHSGRFCKPNRTDRLEPKIAYHHPLLDRKFGIAPDDPVMSDDELRRLIERFVDAARIAESCGAQFVDVKHCHGYLGHELLSAYTRPGPFGGPLENRGAGGHAAEDRCAVERV
jgi:2,4-dienoyl-CoA reductase-like NADH-dependent reductase (Old Yellow Enzyme family)